MNESRPVLLQHAPTGMSNVVAKIKLESLIQSWISNRSAHAVLEGFKDGVMIEITPEEIQSLDNLNKSFRLSNVQLYSEEVKNLCDGFYSQTGHVLTGNLYYTPHSEAQCFTWHSDSQYSFIYQLLGEKRWSFLKDKEKYIREINDQEVILKKFLNKELDSEEEHFILKEGSWLEFPYCLLHKAHNLGNTPSVHITFSYNIPTWGDFAAFFFKKVFGKTFEVERDKEVSKEEVLQALGRFDEDLVSIKKEFKVHFNKFQQSKNSKGRPYGININE